MLLNSLTVLTELLTAGAASLPYSTIENIGSTTLECILLSGTIFFLSYFLLKKKSIPVFYPIFFLVLFVFADAVRDIVSKTTNELIVYNTPGSSTIGIRSGKILNLFTDTSIVVPEVKRHSATLGLKIKSTEMTNNYYCINAGSKKILITNFLNNTIIQNIVPDILVLTGKSPAIEKVLNLRHPPALVIISSEATAGFRIPAQVVLTGVDSIHFVRKSGAFIKRI
jgi:hypothetical protein